MTYRPGVWSCTYYPETQSTQVVPDIYQHRDYSGDFATTPQWDPPTEDADGYCTWDASGNAMVWNANDTLEDQ